MRGSHRRRTCAVQWSPSSAPRRGAALALALALLVLLTGTAAAAGTPAAAERRLAVLEFRGTIAPEVLGAMADEARAGALEVAQPAGYLVITRESMAVILREMGRPNATCAEGECEVETGRNIGADVIVTGEVVQIDKSYLLALKVHETFRGALLASRSVDDVALLELVKKVRGATSAMLRQALNLGSGGVAEGAIGDRPGGGYGARRDVEEVAVQFESDPVGAVVRVDGQLICQATPCSRRLAVGPHQVTMERERYAAASGTVEARRGARFALRLVPAFGWLTVESEPPGMRFSIDGKEVGKTPFVRRELEPGTYELLPEEPCYLRTGERVQVERGENRTVRLRPALRKAAVKVDAQDDRGNAIDGEVWVNRARIGPTGRALEVMLCSKDIQVIAGGRSWTGTVALRENETTTVTAVLGSVPFGRWVPDAPAPGTVPEIPSQAPTGPQPPQQVAPSRGFPTLGVALIVTGLAVGLAGSIWAGSIHDDLKKMPPGAPGIDAAITRGKVANGIGIAGWVTGGVGAALVIVRF